MEPRLALCMIVKGTDDEAPLLDTCLKSVSEYVDGIFIDVNAPEGKKPSKKVLGVAKQYKADVQETVWTGNFVKARNDNMARVPDDFTHILWLDSDDTIENPEKIKEVCALMDRDVSGLYIKYDYAHDEYGNVTVSHYPCRVVKNNGTFTWQSSFADADITVHETLNPRRSTGKIMNDEFWVVHHASDDRRDDSLRRNINLLEGMLKKSEDNPDPRILFYLATHYMDARFYVQAESLFMRYLTMSGWAEERSQAWVYVGDIWKLRNDTEKARGCYMKALAENPNDSSPYIELGELEVADQLWDKAIEWLEMATNKKQKDTVIVLKPMEATYRAYKLLAEAYSNSGASGLEKAATYIDKALELRPFDPELHGARDVILELKKERELNQAALTLVNELKNKHEYFKITELVDALPDHMQDSPLIHSVRNYYRKPTEWPKKSVAIICGSSALGDWGPWSLEEGIGGSEEAVVQLSKQLNDLGWKVTVYATPGRRAGEHDGVQWRHYWEVNPKDKFDVLIGWRDPSMFDKAYRARKRYLWLHDVIDREELTKERLANLEGVIFVGQYHRDLFPMVPDGKAVVSGNGIDPVLFEELDGKVERNPKKVIYMSAHERGQDILQKIWPDVVKEVPDAELHCYYGWAGYDFVNKDNPERMEWKHRLIQQQKTLKNFTDHGKINHTKIAEECQSAGIWAYPTGFPEVYCITAVKAQAGGAYPVTSDYAALQENVHFGERLPMEEKDKSSHVGGWTEEEIETYKKALIHALKNPVEESVRDDMKHWARTNRSWRAVAEQWDEQFTK